MRINGSGNDPVGNRGLDRAANQHDHSKTGTVKGDPDSSGPASVVSIGKAASEAAHAAEGRVDAEVQARLETVRAQLNSGEYRIDFDQLAERLFDDDAARSGGSS